MNESEKEVFTRLNGMLARLLARIEAQDKVLVLMRDELEMHQQALRGHQIMIEALGLAGAPNTPPPAAPVN